METIEQLPDMQGIINFCTKQLVKHVKISFSKHTGYEEELYFPSFVIEESSNEIWESARKSTYHDTRTVVEIALTKLCVKERFIFRPNPENSDNKNLLYKACVQAVGEYIYKNLKEQTEPKKE